MKLNYDIEKINRVLNTFHTVTNASICLFDCDFNMISASGNLADYCVEIRKNPELHKKCLKSDKAFAYECSKNNKSITYTCHAGIVETISPVVLNGILLGYIIFGGLRDLDGEFSNGETVLSACEKYRLSYKRFYKLYKNLSLLIKKN